MIRFLKAPLRNSIGTERRGRTVMKREMLTITSSALRPGLCVIVLRCANVIAVAKYDKPFSLPRWHTRIGSWRKEGTTLGGPFFKNAVFVSRREPLDKFGPSGEVHVRPYAATLGA